MDSERTGWVWSRQVLGWGVIISDATSYDLLANESLGGHAHLSSQILRVECLALDSRTQRLT